MEAKELRIGNLVTINNPVYHPTLKDIPMVVIEIQCRGENDYIVSLFDVNRSEIKYFQNYSQYIKYIDPIPLTEE